MKARGVLVLAWAAFAERSAHDKCSHIRDEDVAFALGPQFRAGWRRRFLNGNRTTCGGAGLSLGVARKVFSVGMAHTDVRGAVVAELEARGLRVGNVDGTRFYGEVVRRRNGERASTFFDGDHGAAAFRARAGEFLDDLDAAHGLFLGQFAHELLTAYPTSLVVAAKRNTTTWLAAEVDRPRPDPDDRDRTWPFVHGAKAFDAYLSTKRYVEYYAALLRRVPCCQLLLVDPDDANDAWDDRLRSFLKRAKVKRPPRAADAAASPGAT